MVRNGRGLHGSKSIHRKAGVSIYDQIPLVLFITIWIAKLILCQPSYSWRSVNTSPGMQSKMSLLFTGSGNTSEAGRHWEHMSCWRDPRVFPIAVNSASSKPLVLEIITWRYWGQRYLWLPKSCFTQLSCKKKKEAEYVVLEQKYSTLTKIWIFSARARWNSFANLLTCCFNILPWLCL